MKEFTLEDLLQKNEWHLFDREFQRGHGIPCRFCGRTSADHATLGHLEHDSQKIPPHWKKALKRFRVSLVDCPRYIPKNIREWERLEKAEENETSRRYGFGH